MMNEVRLSGSELKKILSYMDRLGIDPNMGYAIITESENCGIGTNIEVKFSISVHDIPGVFTVVIRDESSW
jgi:hypothetical protein